MSYTFKSIADVEVVAEPAESSNVLIEEDGVIRKAPKSAVGGSGGSEELYISFNGDEWDSATGSYLILSTTENLYEKLKEKLDKHIGFTVGIYDYRYYDNNIHFSKSQHDSTYYYETPDQFFDLTGGPYEAYVYSGGTIKVIPYD